MDPIMGTVPNKSIPSGRSTEVSVFETVVSSNGVT
jgi:hypothetical protein